MATKAQQMDVTQLNIQQLQQVSQQLEQEIEFFTNSLSQLKLAQGKFVESQESLDQVNNENVGKEILVPLTSSMYVSGKLDPNENVLLDIGTGYYIEKDIGGAKDYFKRKVEFISKQIDKIQPILQEKYKNKQAVVEVLQLKVQAQLAVQQQQMATAGGPSKS